VVAGLGPAHPLGLPRTGRTARRESASGAVLGDRRVLSAEGALEVGRAPRSFSELDRGPNRGSGVRGPRARRADGLPVPPGGRVEAGDASWSCDAFGRQGAAARGSSRTRRRAAKRGRGRPRPAFRSAGLRSGSVVGTALGSPEAMGERGSQNGGPTVWASLIRDGTGGAHSLGAVRGVTDDRSIYRYIAPTSPLPREGVVGLQPRG
jgi:hypothetical protein